MVAFVLGALIPLLGVVFAPVPVRLPVTIAAVLLALAVTGFTSARLSGVPVNRPVLRNLVVGTAAMGLTYAAEPWSAPSCRDGNGLITDHVGCVAQKLGGTID